MEPEVVDEEQKEEAKAQIADFVIKVVIANCDPIR